jgi:hypothetical protein
MDDFVELRGKNHSQKTERKRGNGRYSAKVSPFIPDLLFRIIDTQYIVLYNG